MNINMPGGVVSPGSSKGNKMIQLSNKKYNTNSNLHKCQHCEKQISKGLLCKDCEIINNNKPKDFLAIIITSFS